MIIRGFEYPGWETWACLPDDATADEIAYAKGEWPPDRIWGPVSRMLHPGSGVAVASVIGSGVYPHASIGVRDETPSETASDSSTDMPHVLQLFETERDLLLALTNQEEPLCRQH